jgi:hypothetical protein
LAKIEGALERDPVAGAEQVKRSLVLALTPIKKQRECAAILEKAIATGPEDGEVLEGLLTQRIVVLNGLKDYAGALVCAKSYFNACAMAHTADAITVLDREFLLPNMEDRSRVEQFRREQVAGSVPVAPGQAGGGGKVSALMQGIKVESGAYQAGLAKMADDATLKGITRHVALLLVADMPKEALAVAKTGLAVAATPAEIAAAHELIARCYKAQDGTIGRANGWISGNPQTK